MRVSRAGDTFQVYLRLRSAPCDDLPLLDTTRLRSQMAVDFIFGKPGLGHVHTDQ